jgi:phenylacetate-CoA ligase
MATWVPGSYPDDYSEASTSGSTGKPVTVTKFTPTQGIEYHAGELFSLLINGVNLDRDFLAYRTRESPEVNPAPLGEPFSFVGARGRLFFLSTDEIPLDEVLMSIAQHNIETLIATPYALNALARRLAEQNRRDVHVGNVLTFAGRVNPYLREITEEYLNARIIDVYSSAEVGHIAFQCPHSDHLHPSQIINYVEILDRNDLPCEVGQVGRVVVTALRSYGMPLIRYEIGDTASWGNSCQFGISLPVLLPEIVRERETYIDAKGFYQTINLDKGSFIKNPLVRDYLLLVFQNKQVLFLSGQLNFNDVELVKIQGEVQEISGIDLGVEVIVTQDSSWLKKDKPKTVVFVDGEYPVGASVEHFSQYVSNSLA